MKSRRLAIWIFTLFQIFMTGLINGQNLVQNPGFESGKINDYWYSWQGTPVLSEVAHSGNFAVKAATAGMTFYQNIPISAGTSYTVSAWVKNEPGATLYFGVKGFGNPEQNISTGSTTYIQLSLSFTCASGYDNVQLYIYKPDNTASYADDFEMNAVTAPCAGCFTGGAGNYYVRPAGNDSNSGTSVTDAWQTIDKVNKGMFKPGDVIHFEGGKTFEGTLILNDRDAGAEGAFVQLTSYNGEKAIIHSGNDGGLKLINTSRIIISDLVFTGSGRKSGNTADGIKINYAENIILDNIEVYGYQHSGIAIAVSDQIKINGISAHDNGFAGISSMGVLNGKRNNTIYIGKSKVYNNPGDPTVLDNHSGNGIVTGETDNVIIEYCEAYNNGWDMPRKGNGPVGIWAWNGNNILIQHCIAHDNKTAPGADDGGGFDLDGGVTNSVIQYCLAYNNQGSGFGIFQFSGAAPWNNNTIRYCISENDGNVTAGAGVYLWNGSGLSSGFHTLHFYNNVIYNSQKACIRFADHNYSNFNFFNNVFVSRGSAISGGLGTESFLGNCWWNIDGGFNTEGETDFSRWIRSTGKEQIDGRPAGINENPLFINPGNSNVTDPLQMQYVTDYQTPPVSPLINAGIDLRILFTINPGASDYFGNLLKTSGTPDIGVFEHGIVSAVYSASLKILPAYPNPVKSMLYIDAANITGVIKTVKFINTSGRTIKETPVSFNQNRLEIPAEDLAPEIYVVQITTTEGLFIARIIKE